MCTRACVHVCVYVYVIFTVYDKMQWLIIHVVLLFTYLSAVVVLYNCASWWWLDSVFLVSYYRLCTFLINVFLLYVQRKKNDSHKHSSLSSRTSQSTLNIHALVYKLILYHCIFPVMLYDGVSKLLGHVTLFHTIIVFWSRYVQTRVYHLRDRFYFRSKFLFDTV